MTANFLKKLITSISPKILTLTLLVSSSAFLLKNFAVGQPVKCQMVSTSVISSVEQAKCLLRQPRIGGQVGPVLDRLPSPLDQLLTKPTIDLTKEQFRKYLVANSIREQDIGGSLDNPVSKNGSNEIARYFVIHDTSAPNFGNKPFLDNINRSSWSGNNLATAPKVAHIFVNRVGNSVTKIDFKTPVDATKYERNDSQIGLFLHVESVQPRRCKPKSGQTKCSEPFNDMIAPDPGFTKEQLKRLAVVYIAASVRRGKWLIPAFHVALDQGVGDHDDPQNFILEKWTEQLNLVLNEIRS